MSLCSLTNVSVNFGPHEVLRSVDLQLNAGARLGLVGRNGAGKTTLLRVITGEQAPDRGQFHLQRGCVVRLLKQERSFGTTVGDAQTVMDVVLRARPDVLAVEAQLEAVQRRMESGAPDAALVEQHGVLTERYAALDGYQLRPRARQVLDGLGLPQRMWDQRATSLSGGESGRLELASLLLSKPDLLLLDEPTNHLDMDAVEFLEGWLREFKGAVLLVSHDRTFLDNAVTGIAELKNGTVEMYAGGYSDYAVERELREARRLKAFEEQQAYIARTEAWISKNIASATSARQAQSKRKMLARMDRMDAPEGTQKVARLAFPLSMRSVEDVLTVRGLTHGFGERTLFENVDLTIKRGEKIGVAGPNGAGKSTLGRILAGKFGARAGSVTVGRKVDLLYFDQAQADVPRKGTPFSLVRDAHTTATNEMLRGHLGRFAFSAAEADKDVETLSGGERARLALALLTLTPANVLILDEPTNHLDLDTREALENALDAFDGTVLLISHDRYLLDTVTEHTIFVSGGRVLREPGCYSDARASIRAQLAPASGPAGESAERQETQAQTHKRLEKERRAVERDLKKTEERIAAVEKRMAECDAQMAVPDVGWQALQAAQQERATLASELDTLMADWERLGVTLSSL